MSLHGISFAPLLAQAPRLAAAAADINARATEKARLRAEISAARRRIKKLLPEVDAGAACVRACIEQFSRGPKRLAHLDLEDLARLWGIITDIHTVLCESRLHRQEAAPETVDSSDRSENSGRQSYITTDSNSKACNQFPIRHAEKHGSDKRAALAETRATCGLEHVPLEMMLAAAPPEWSAALARSGQASWSALVAVAYERTRPLGINQAAWALAQAALGRQGAAVLVMIADAKHSARGGTIRNPGAWMHRMAERAERGEAHLHRSVFGILHGLRQLQ